MLQRASSWTDHGGLNPRLGVTDLRLLICRQYPPFVRQVSIDSPVEHTDLQLELVLGGAVGPDHFAESLRREDLFPDELCIGWDPRTVLGQLVGRF